MKLAASPRTVLYLAWAPFFSGAERALLLTLQSLDPARYRPVVVAGTEGEFASHVRDLGIPCDVFELRHLDRRHLPTAARSILRVRRVARAHGVSLIHANDMPSFQPGGYAARLLGIPAVTHIRFPDTHEGYAWFLRTPVSRALFVSHYLMEQACGEAPAIFGNRSQVLHDCVAPQDSWSDAQRVQARRELGLPGDAVLVAMAGQVAEVKGIWDFVAAAQVCAAGHARLHFVVLGDDLKTGGTVRRAMEERVQSLGLAARFTFLGFRPDAPRLVQAFDIVAVPSLVEPLGNATLEAMAAGRPVVGTRVGGIPEMVVEAETGLLVPVANPAALADAFERLAADDTLRARMGQAARRRAGEAFGMARHGAELQRVYDSLSAPGIRRVPGGDAA